MEKASIIMVRVEGMKVCGNVMRSMARARFILRVGIGMKANGSMAKSLVKEYFFILMGAKKPDNIRIDLVSVSINLL